MTGKRDGSSTSYRRGGASDWRGRRVARVEDAAYRRIVTAGSEAAVVIRRVLACAAKRASVGGAACEPGRLEKRRSSSAGCGRHDSRVIGAGSERVEARGAAGRGGLWRVRGDRYAVRGRSIRSRLYAGAVATDRREARIGARASTNGRCAGSCGGSSSSYARPARRRMRVPDIPGDSKHAPARAAAIGAMCDESSR